VTHAATTSVAQIEFAASQNRQEVTKLDEKECEEATRIQLGTALGEKLLMYRLNTRRHTHRRFYARERFRFSLQARTKSSIERRWSQGVGLVCKPARRPAKLSQIHSDQLLPLSQLENLRWAVLPAFGTFVLALTVRTLCERRAFIKNCYQDAG